MKKKLEENWEGTQESVVLKPDFMDEGHQGHGMYLGQRIKINREEMEQLKEIMDKEINKNMPVSASKKYNVAHYPKDLRISKDSEKLKQIPVSVERLDQGGILVKIGPCDLSGVGGHQIREELIKDLVTQALKENNINKKYIEVGVSALIGVRGRSQMAKGFFTDTRIEPGAHMNAYIKTDKEKHLTHWEPRNGPQSFFNDTICSLVTCVVTSLFENGIRTSTIDSSKEATHSILKNPDLKEIFNDLLDRTTDRITNLIKAIKNKFNFQENKEKLSHIIQKENDNSGGHIFLQS